MQVGASLFNQLKCKGVHPNAVRTNRAIGVIRRSEREKNLGRANFLSGAAEE